MADAARRRELAGLMLAVAFLCGSVAGIVAVFWSLIAHFAFGDPRGTWPPALYWWIAIGTTAGAVALYALVTWPILRETDELREQIRELERRAV